MRKISVPAIAFEINPTPAEPTTKQPHNKWILCITAAQRDTETTPSVLFSIVLTLSNGIQWVLSKWLKLTIRFILQNSSSSIQWIIHCCETMAFAKNLNYNHLITNAEAFPSTKLADIKYLLQVKLKSNNNHKTISLALDCGVVKGRKVSLIHLLCTPCCCARAYSRFRWPIQIFTLLIKWLRNHCLPFSQPDYHLILNRYRMLCVWVSVCAYARLGQCECAGMFELVLLDVVFAWNGLRAFESGCNAESHEETGQKRRGVDENSSTADGSNWIDMKR